LEVVKNINQIRHGFESEQKCSFSQIYLKRKLKTMKARIDSVFYGFSWADFLLFEEKVLFYLERNKN